MKKKYLIIIVFLLAFFISYNVIKSKSSYTQNIYSNWSIKLPSTSTVIYPFNSQNDELNESNKRYHIFKILNSSEIEDIVQWRIKDNPSFENDINKLLKGFNNIPSEYFPKFQCDYKYFLKKKENDSLLCMIFIPSSNLVYIIEYLEN